MEEEEKIIISPDTKREERVPPGQQAVDGLPVLHEGGIPIIDPAHWTLKITGLVDQEKIIPYDEFIKLPWVKVHADIHCVTTWSRLDTVWEGINSLELKKLVNIDPKAKFVMIYAEQGYSTNLPIEEFFQEDVVFALRYNGELITPEHGAPVRLVVPRLYFWKSPKWVNGVEFMQHDKRGYWEMRGYHNHADPWKEERYSNQE